MNWGIGLFVIGIIGLTFLRFDLDEINSRKQFLSFGEVIARLSLFIIFLGCTFSGIYIATK